jgi:hypothetical protein
MDIVTPKSPNSSGGRILAKTMPITSANAELIMLPIKRNPIARPVRNVKDDL